MNTWNMLLLDLAPVRSDLEALAAQTPGAQVAAPEAGRAREELLANARRILEQLAGAETISPPEPAGEPVLPPGEWFAVKFLEQAADFEIAAWREATAPAVSLQGIWEEGKLGEIHLRVGEDTWSNRPGLLSEISGVLDPSLVTETFQETLTDEAKERFKAAYAQARAERARAGGWACPVCAWFNVETSATCARCGQYPSGTLRPAAEVGLPPVASEFGRGLASVAETPPQPPSIEYGNAAFDFLDQVAQKFPGKLAEKVKDRVVEKLEEKVTAALTAQERSCVACGHPIREQARFCDACGADQQAGSMPPSKPARPTSLPH